MRILARRGEKAPGVYKMIKLLQAQKAILEDEPDKEEPDATI